jgi:RND family efflux transporter MFP subunit
MQFISSIFSRLVSWYGKRTVVSFIGVALLLTALGIYKLSPSDSEVPLELTSLPVVTLQDVGAMSGDLNALSVLGTVEATREARLQTEAGGRVTTVNVTLGDTVRAGAVLATIENSRERAVVLQAQGSYEAALAGANSGDASLATAERSLSEAKVAAENTFRSSLTSVEGVVRNTIDSLFSDATGAFPGLLIDGKGRATELSLERTRISGLLSDWRSDTEGSGSATLDSAEENAKRVSVFLADLSELYAEDKNLPPSLVGAGAGLSVARSQIDGTLASISGARSALIGAESAVAQAKIAGANTTASASDAQLKQALGSLRLAQANLEKTIIRSPISGTVQSLTVKAGTTVGMGTPAAIVSSEGALEIVTYVTDDEARIIAVGDTVTVQNTLQGVITGIASAIDPSTKKIEIRIGVENKGDVLTNGQSVTVALASVSGTETSQKNTAISLPIIALKMTPDGAIVFTVNETDSTLVAHPVVLGAIRGDSVMVASGVTPTMRIVEDARGLRAGEKVQVK